MKKLLSLLVLTFITLSGYPQNQHLIDSLFSVLQTANADTAKVNTLNSLAYEFRNSNPDTSIYFASQAQTLALNLNYKMGIANACLMIGTAITNLGKFDEALKNLNDALEIYDQLLLNASGTEKTGEKSKILKKKGNAFNNIGSVFLYQGNYPEALKNYTAALKIREEAGDKLFAAYTYGNIGLIYHLQGNYPEALKNHSAALRIEEEIGDKPGIATSNLNIGSVFVRLGNYPEALKNYFAVLRIQEEIGNKPGIASAYLNIGAVYMYQGDYPNSLKNSFAALKIQEEIGNKREISTIFNNIAGVYAYQGNYPEALKNYFAGLKIQEEIGDKQSAAASYGNIGRIYSMQGNYPEALKNHLASKKIAEEIGDKYQMAMCFSYVGYDYVKLKKYDEASLSLNQGLLLAKEIGGIEVIKENYSGLTALDSARGNFKQALEHYKLFISARDSLVNQENTKKITQQQMQYDFDKKEALGKVEQEKKDAIAQKELQRQKLVRNGFVGGFAVVLLFAVVFFTQRNKIKKGKKLSDELLLNILPAEVAEELKAKGSAEAKLIDDVTVLFTDFKGFTQLSEKLSPKDLVAEINECFSAFDYIMQKYGVEKIKTIGDSYMAAGGLPTPNRTHAGDVVKAALDIQRYMKEHKTRKEAAGELFFEIRIGVHTGPVVAGIVGVKKFAYDIWGDTVNTASRMESSGEADRVNISGTTYELVKDDYTCIHRGKVQAKGKGMIDMYFVEMKNRP